MLLNIRRQPNFAVHFVFALHFHAFFFLLGAIYLLVTEIFEKLHLIIVNQVMAVVALIGALLYLFVGMKKVYRDSVGIAALKYVALLLIYGLVLTLVSLTTLLLLSSS
jgi:hypothetical protein